MRVLEGLFAAMIRKTIIALAGLALMTSAAWAQNRKEIYELQERCGRRAEQIYEKDYLRSRLADLLKANDALLKSKDPALRQSFYRRFNPASYPHWPEFAKADEEGFLDAALWNGLLWRTAETRSALNQLCWAHPDPKSNMDQPNFYNGREKRMREEHPEYFADEDGGTR